MKNSTRNLMAGTAALALLALPLSAQEPPQEEPQPAEQMTEVVQEEKAPAIEEAAEVVSEVPAEADEAQLDETASADADESVERELPKTAGPAGLLAVLGLTGLGFAGARRLRK
ncbi:MAG: hypothetical protein AAGK22_13705 [Acidobacteriota bacterium]